MEIIMGLVIFAVLLIIVMQVFNERSQRALEKKLDEKYGERLKKLEKQMAALENTETKKS
jgi:low affinity Fe/Cu permease